MTSSPTGHDSSDGPRIELPVVTHWSHATQTFEYLAADAPSVEGSAQAPFAPGGCHYQYARDFLPDFNSYLGDMYAVTPISDEEARDFIHSAAEDTGVRVDLLRPDAYESRDRGAGRLLSDCDAVQILHAKVIDGSLATIILPPHWSRDAGEGTYPIVFNGFYDINANLFTQEGPYWVRMIARSGTEGRSGAVGVLWNGGGAIGSRTLNAAAYRQFHSVIDYVTRNFGGARHRILMAGGSRGGATAINMASNPHGYDYTVVFTAPTAALVILGEHGILSSVTYPPLLGGIGWSVGLADAWRTGWAYPECAGRPHLTGHSGVEALAHVLMGTTRLEEADTFHSPGSDRFIRGLQRAGTRVFLTITEKDHFIPYNTQVKYVQRLQERGIPLQVEALLRGGHTERWVDTAIGRTYARLGKLLEHVMALVEGRSLPDFPPSFTYYAVDRGTGVLQPMTPADGMAPFSVDAPYVAARGMRFPLVFAGHPGTRYELTIEPSGGPASPAGQPGTERSRAAVAASGPGEPAGAADVPEPAHAQAVRPVAAFTGTLPGDLGAVHWFQVPADLPVGRYAYALRIRKPGAGWKEIPVTHTPSGGPATLDIQAEEPNISADEAWEWCAAPKLEVEDTPHTGTNWGLSEY